MPSMWDAEFPSVGASVRAASMKHAAFFPVYFLTQKLRKKK